MSSRQCEYVKDDGTRCGVFFGICDCHDQCFHHAPCREEERLESRRKGGRATAEKRSPPGLTDEELPSLDSFQAAEHWLEAIGRAVATGRLAHNQAQAAIRSVREWLRAHETGDMAEQVEELQETVQELQRKRLEAV